jgi:hypothetical protein
MNKSFKQSSESHLKGGFRELVKHLLAERLELLREFSVQVPFEGFIHERDSKCTAMAGTAAVRSSAVCRIRARARNCLGGLGSHLKLRGLVPNEESRVCSDEVSGPLV